MRECQRNCFSDNEETDAVPGRGSGLYEEYGSSASTVRSQGVLRNQTNIAWDQESNHERDTC
jgi:hypothetical protein